MFKLIKNLGKKKVVSSKNMTTDEYVSAIEGGIIPHWEDKIVAEKIGVKSLFEDGASVTKTMSIENARECTARLTRMVNIGNYVSTTFSKRSSALKNDDNTTQEQRADFYTANTIKNLFIEAQDKVQLEIDESLTDYDKIIESINIQLAGLNSLKSIVLSSVVVFASLACENMTGFVD